MTDSKHVVIVGGHGKIALMAAAKFVGAGHPVTSLIRNPEHIADVSSTGATPVVIDVETASKDELAEAFKGADAVVFSAGAGGGNPARTHAVDYLGATKSMDAAEHADVDRFVMVSYARARVDVDRLDRDDSFYPYAKAKHDADGHLRGSDLDYTILGPGGLTFESASGKIQLADEVGAVPGHDVPAEDRITSRENVAEVIVHVVANDVAKHETVNFYDGGVPIAEAIR